MVENVCSGLRIQGSEGNLPQKDPSGPFGYLLLSLPKLCKYILFYIGHSIQILGVKEFLNLISWQCCTYSVSSGNTSGPNVAQ